MIPLFGKYLCYAILAVALDLVWGYCGILSLGHGAFFALGGYAMGMYLMRQIGTRGVYGDPVLPDFMVFLNWKDLPVTWWGFNWFPFALVMVLLVPGVLAYVFGWFAFRSRVTGVYLSIITQAMTYALWLAFFRNDMGFGGNNGLTDFKDILGFSIQAPGTRIALFVLSVIVLALALLIGRFVTTSKFGKVLVAIRDAESRTRFVGYRVENYKLVTFTLSAMLAGVAGALYVPQVGIINPERVRAAELDRGSGLGGGRRARHAGRRGARRDHRQSWQDDPHRRFAGSVVVRARSPVPSGHHVPAKGPARPLRAVAPHGAPAGRAEAAQRRPRRGAGRGRPADPRRVARPSG